MPMRLRLAMASLALIVITSGQAQAVAGFACDSEACACNINKPKDCDAMKVNCAGGKLGGCEPWGTTTLCTCKLGVADTKPLSKPQVSALWKMMLKKTQRVAP